jgi:hypothetical protein
MDKRDAMTSMDPQMIWKFFKEFEAAERHFNTLQNQYRTLASTWLLASFAGIGFTLTQERFAVPLDRLLLVAAIGLATCVGTTLLWNLDLRVYHQLMFAYFMEGHRLEQQYSWLPQVRTTIRRTMKGRGVTGRVVLFYIAGNSAALVIGGLALAFWSAKYGVATVIFISVFWLLLIVAMGFWIFRASINITQEARQNNLVSGL